MSKKFRSVTRKYSAYKKIKAKRIERVRKHPFIIPVVTFMVLFFLSIGGVIGVSGTTVGADDARIVQLTDNGNSQTVPTRATTVSDLLKRLNIELNEADIVEPALDTPIFEDNFSVNIFRARPVTITDDKGMRVTTLSAYQEPRVIAEKAGISVRAEDEVALTREEDIVASGFIGQKVEINRALPVFLNLYGTSIPLYTHANTVEELLKEKNVQVIEGDTTQPTADTAITENILVFVLQKGKTIISEEVSIPAPVESVDDISLALGRSVVRQEGVAGKKIVTSEVNAPNGVEIGRKIIQEVIVSQPVKRIIAKGTKSRIAANLTGTKVDWMTSVGLSPNEFQYADYIISRESGWCPTKWQGHPGTCPDFYQELYSTSSSRGYGLCQSTPPSKMASEGSDWQTNPITQLKWCTNYARKRYGSWQKAYDFWSVNHWW